PVSTKLGGATKRGHVSQALEVSLPPYETPPNAWRVKIHAAAAEAMRAAGIVYSETEWLADEVQLVMTASMLQFHEVDNRLKDVLSRPFAGSRGWTKEGSESSLPSSRTTFKLFEPLLKRSQEVSSG